MTEKAAAKRRTYTVEETDAILTELALCGGNAGMAVKRLATVGLRISPRTLSDWRNRTHEARYIEICRIRSEEIEQRLTERLRDVGRQAADATEVAVQKTVEKLEADKLQDPSTAARNLATVTGIHIDKYLKVTGRADLVIEHVHHHDASELVGKIAKSLGIDLDAIDSTAEDIPLATEITSSAPGGFERQGAADQ